MHCINTIIFSITITLSAHVAFSQDRATGEHQHTTTLPQNIFLLMMDTMMTKMEEAPSGFMPEYDFMCQMIPHHEGAIAMSKYEIEHGRSEQLIQLAKSIISEQSNDIKLMQLLTSQLPAAKSNDKTFANAMVQCMNVMMKNMPSGNVPADVDKAFALVMIPHHRAAIDMATACIQFTVNVQVSIFAKQLISTEQIEIEQLSAFIQ